MAHERFEGNVVLARTLLKVPEGAFASVSSRVERKMQEAVYQVGRLVRDDARRLAPKKTGALAASIYVSKGKVDRSSGAVKHVGGNAYTKQSTLGYFRAVNAATRRNPNRIDVFDPEDKLVNPITQRPYGSMKHMFSTTINKFEENKYLVYHKFGVDEDEVSFAEAMTPSVMQLGGAGRQAFFVTVGAAAYYAGFVEFGHHAGKNGNVWVPPTPFLSEAIEACRPYLNEAIAEVLREAAMEVARKA